MIILMIMLMIMLMMMMIMMMMPRVVIRRGREMRLKEGGGDQPSKQARVERGGGWETEMAVNGKKSKAKKLQIAMAMITMMLMMLFIFTDIIMLTNMKARVKLRRCGSL